MASILWACWDGGGNLTPGIGIGRALVERGHDVHYVGRPEMVGRVMAAGLSAAAFAHARTDLPRYAFDPGATVFGFTSSPTVGEELAALVAARRPDVVVVDAMFTAALEVAPRFARPTAVMLHTFFDHLVDAWRANVAMQGELRRRAGFAALPDLDALWGARERLHVNALQALDAPPATTWGHVVHGAPVLTAERQAVAVDLPWGDDDPTPLVLLSFSTVPEQRSPVMLGRALEALGTLPVHVVATTGGIVDPGELAAPANAHLVAFADHEALMARASLVVGHGGHGTTMRALRRGVPMVGIPAAGVDQVVITRQLERWGSGRALGRDASAAEIAAAAREVLSNEAYRAEARRCALAFAGRDGAALAADSVEALL